jgi:rsbT co-antagonist protein RsbR
MEADELVTERIADVLMALAEVADGNLDQQLKSELPETHPLGALAVGINEMTRALAQAQRDSLASRRALEEQVALIERQRVAMRELSTPVIEVWQGVICLPIVGVVDTVRSTEMTEGLLHAIVSRGVECAIVDITGIDVIDTKTADHFLRMAKAVRLLGARCVLTGINPRIAQTLVHMGVDLAEIECHQTLRDALKEQVTRARPPGRRREA